MQGAALAENNEESIHLSNLIQVIENKLSVTVVCTATAWKMEAAIFSLDIFLAIRFCMSVLQNTPQREAIEYT